MAVDEKYPLALPTGTVLAGQYTIDKVLGQGGFGITYKATDYKTNGKVAVKEFFPDTLAYREMTTVISYPGERSENYEYGKEGFLQEAKTLAEFIGCENIVRIHSYFEENGTAYFVMDYIEGTSFDEYLKQKGGKISCEEAKRILIPIMEALAVVHSKGIVHRDVTPDNIYITNDGTVKLLDFGAARYSLGDKSRSLDVILKHGFAPKEQYTRRGKQGPFTDIYSLGATFYFALTGKRPPDSVERLDEDELIPPSNLGVQITEYQEEAILKALNVQPGDRYQSMLEFRDTFLNEAPAPAQPTPVVQQFFTAPVQQPSVTVQQPAGTSQQPVYAAKVDAPQQTQAVYAAKVDAPQQPQAVYATAVKPKKNKKLIIIAASAVAVIGIISAIAVPGILKSKENDDILTSNSYEETTTTKSDQGDSDLPAEEPAVTTAPPKTTTAPPATTTAAPASTGDAAIIGNRVGNIKNGGLRLANNKYWIDDNRHAIKGWNSEGEAVDILTDTDGEFSNLVIDGDNLYFIYNHKICLYSISAKKGGTVPELEKYSAQLMRFYLSKDYYFVYTMNSNQDDGVLYRISRSTGKAEQSIKIAFETDFNFWDDKLYYIERTSEKNYVRRISSTDFNVVYKKWSYNANIRELTAANGYIYFICHSSDGNTYIEKYDYELNERVDRFNITDICKKHAGDKYEIVGLNVIDNQMFIGIYSYANYSPGLYHIVDKGDTFTYDEIRPCGSGIWGNHVYKGDDYYEVNYMGSDGILRFVQYDMNGNLIK